jgi:hypothetical protein
MPQDDRDLPPSRIQNEANMAGQGEKQISTQQFTKGG